MKRIKLIENNYATKPSVAKIRVYSGLSGYGSWVLAYLCSDGMWHFDDDELKAACRELDCSESELIVVTL